MGDLYTLPLAIGGQEFTACDQSLMDVPDGYIAGSVGTFRTHEPIMLVQKRWLTEVKPPLPTEPGAYLDKGGQAWQFDGSTWWFGGTDLAPAAVAQHAPFTRLVPSPAPVELPWEGRTGSSQPVAVSQTDEGWTSVEVAGKAVFVINQKYAAEMAAALWTAANR